MKGLRSPRGRGFRKILRCHFGEWLKWDEERFEDESHSESNSGSRGDRRNVSDRLGRVWRSSADDGKGKVYFLNFKPETADQWVALAKKYTDKTGVQVKVQTAASGTYEQTLKSELAKSDAPTIFQVNGPVGYQNWKGYTADLKDTGIYNELNNKDIALKDGDKVWASRTSWRPTASSTTRTCSRSTPSCRAQDQGRQGDQLLRQAQGSL